MNRNVCPLGVVIASLVSLVIAPRPGHAERLPIRTYTTADGLASTFVQCIRRDSRGFLWFCTRDGLSRFDGQRFVTYGSDDGLPTTTINDFLEARDGTIWVATNGGGACRFNPTATARHQRFTRFPVGDTRASNRVNALYEDRNDHIWAGSDSGLFRLTDPNRPAFDELTLRPPGAGDAYVGGITALAGDTENNLWIGTGFGLIRRLPDGRILRYLSTSPGADRIHALLTDTSGTLWAATDAGVLVVRPTPAAAVRPDQDGRLRHVLRPSAPRSTDRVELPSHAGEAVTFTVADGVADNAVRSLYATADGRIWITTSAGLTEFSGGRFRSFTKAHGLSYQQLESLAGDGEGNLWIATFGAGAMKLILNGFVTFDSGDGLGDQRVHSIFGDGAGSVFVINGEWIVSQFDGRRFKSNRALVPDGSHLRWASPHAFRDHTGQFWMFSNKGLFRYGPSPQAGVIGRERPLAVYTSRDGLPGDAVNRVFEDSRGGLWISVADSVTGLVRRDPSNGAFHTFSEAEGFSPPYTKSSYPSAFAEDHAGNIWIGFDAGGLMRYAAGRFRSFDGRDGVPAGRIMALHVDRRGRLWVGGNEGGLSRVEDPTAERIRVTAFTTAQGLTSNNIRCIAEDTAGRLYVGTGGGVDRLDPATGCVRRFTTADGLASDFLTTAFGDRQGRLWFGTLNGLSRLVPAPDPPRSPPPIWIGAVRLADADYPVPALGASELSGLRLAAGQNRVRFDFFGLSFAMGEVLRYQFKLEGIDRDWGTPTDQRTVYYPGLPDGTYRFMVRALGADGVASSRPASVAFTILPPVWRQGWFVILVSLVSASLLYAVYRYRLAQLLEIERVRTRIATDLHDDIGANLSQIAIMSEVLLQDGAARDPRLENELSLIMNASRESVDSLSDIVWAVNPRRDSLQDLTQRMRRFASDTLSARGIEFTFRGPTDDDHHPGAHLRQQIFLIFKESVTNVARHSGCTHAGVDFGRDGKWLVLRVSDNGSGLDPAKENGGNGLTSIRERARAIGAELDLRAEPGVGTTVRLRIPLKRSRWTLRRRSLLA